MVDIKRRLEQLEKVANQRKEVTAEMCALLWMEYMRYCLIFGDDEVPSLEDYICPPFESVTLEDYQRARKELMEFEQGREVEQ